MAEEMIKLTNISKSFGTHKIIDNLSIDVHNGEFLTLLGPSGCGKTTILRMINGFETPDEGTIEINGEDQKGISPNMRQVNTVFQGYALFPHMTVRENVGFGPMIKKKTKEDIDKAVNQALEMTELEALADRKPGKLSGGQQQRVAIARALVNKPNVLLLDEPLGALDMKLRQQMQLELRHLQQKNKITYVYVTHDQEEALSISDRIVVINKGHIEQIGEPMDIYRHPKTKFVASFLGESNFFEGSYEDGAFIYEGIKVPCEAASENNGANLLSVRPEYVKINMEESTGSIPARITDITYIGKADRIEMTLQNGDRIHALYRPNTLSNDMDVFVSFEKDHMTLIKDTKEEN